MLNILQYNRKTTPERNYTMKRLFVLILTITIVASLFCISAFAAEDPASDVVLRVSATMRDGSTKVIKDYTSFAGEQSG